MNRPVPDEVILGLIKAQPMHGYQLLEKFRDKNQLGRVWTMSTSQMYAVLNRLESQSAVQGREERVSDAPPKTVYSITEIGEKRLQKWLFDKNPPSSIHLIRVLFLSRLYIAVLLGYDTEPIINKQKEVCEKQLMKFHQDEKKNLSGIERLTVCFVISQLRSAIAWLEECSAIQLEPLNIKMNSGED